MRDIETAFSQCNKFKLDTPLNNVRTNSLYRKLGYVVIGSHDGEVNYEKQI